MQNLKERKPLLIKILVVVLLILMCCTLPHWIICKETEGPLFGLVCKKEQDALLLKTCVEVDRNLPPNTEVLVSACVRPSATGVPGGEILFVREGLTDKMYLLDLRTGEKRDVPNDPLLLDHGIFLNSELVWLEGGVAATPNNPNYIPHYILDLTNGKRYELTDLTPSIYRPEPPSYIPYFKSAEQVFIHHSKYTLIALSPDFRQHPERNVFFSESPDQTPSGNFENGKVLEQLMKDLKVNYEVVDLSLRYANVPSSPTGRYIVRNDGIYLSETNTLVVSLPTGFGFTGWYYDESGVITYQDRTYPYSDPGGSSMGTPVYYPILKLRLPAP